MAQARANATTDTTGEPQTADALFDRYDMRQSRFRKVGISRGDVATIDAVQMCSRWIRNSDPSRAAQPARDRLTFALADCNHGRVDFTSSVTGCGEGHMDPTRLTQRRDIVSVSLIGSLNHRSTP